MKQSQPILSRILKALLILFVGSLAFVILVNAIILAKAGPRLQTVETIEASTESYEAILVLGAAAYNETPSQQLQDRLNQGIALYQAGVAPILLLSGDNSGSYYNEVAAMETYALEAGIPSEAIVLDHEGHSTYESLIRAAKVFGLGKIIIVSQEYHLPRALNLADSVDIEAVASPADHSSYENLWFYQVREALARVKDLFTGWLQPPYYSTVRAEP